MENVYFEKSFSVRQTGQMFTSESYLRTHLSWFLLSLLSLYQKSNKNTQNIDNNSCLKVQYRIEIDIFKDYQNCENLQEISVFIKETLVPVALS